MDIKTKDDLVSKLRAYTEVLDDDVIRFKQKIKDTLLKCPELLYALKNTELEKELFDKNGNINATFDENGNIIEVLGEWDRYFGYNIRDYIFIPESQTATHNFLCYTVSWNEVPRYDKVEYYAQIIFTALCSSALEQAHDSEIGVARHDLIGAIIREKFNWSNIFGRKCKIISNQEKVTDTNYATRQIVFQCVTPNAIVNTPLNGETRTINWQTRR